MLNLEKELGVLDGGSGGMYEDFEVGCGCSSSQSHSPATESTMAVPFLLAKADAAEHFASPASADD